MQNIVEIEVISKGTKRSSNTCNDILFFDEAEICINKDGTLNVAAEKFAPEKIILKFDRLFSDKAIVYGDTWERGYGDLLWKKPCECTFMPWYFIASENDKNYCFGVKTGGNSMCYWTIEEKCVCLTVDIRSGNDAVLLNGNTLDAAQIVTSIFEGSGFDASVSFCKMMCENPRVPNIPIYGGNDWYCNYGNNSHENIVRNASFISKCAGSSQHRPFMVIDDGWQVSWNPKFNGGPWRSCNEKFHGMENTASSITQEGAIPGIWMRPLLSSERLSEIPYRSFGDDSMTFIDPSHPASIEYIKNEIRAVRNFGIKMIKFDFLCHDIFGHYGFDMGTELFEKNIPFYNKEKTTAQIIKEFYFALREAAGEDCIIIGCNAVSHMAAGIVDIQRTGDDTSGREWERTLKMGVNTLAWRMHQHKTFYAHDADCVGITKDIPWEKNSMWLRLLAESGTPLFVSVDEDCRTFNVQKALSEAFDTACIKFLQDSYLIPCTNELTPQKWQREEKTFEYKWN